MTVEEWGKEGMKRVRKLSWEEKKRRCEGENVTGRGRLREEGKPEVGQCLGWGKSACIKWNPREDC